ncbi:MAG: hypothetical protein M3164_02320, partial [Actinomycetota bacterium]|nr:hypothetical protein [Actinomycetota bacterium]
RSDSMTNGHGTPLSDAAAFDSLPPEVQEEIRNDFARLRANLPTDELKEDEPVGIGATSAGLLVIKTPRGAYQLMEDGSTLRVRGIRGRREIVRFRRGQIVEQEEL